MCQVTEQFDHLEVINVTIPEQFRKPPSRLPLRVSVAYELTEIKGKAHTCSWSITAASSVHRYILWCTDLYVFIENECHRAGQKIIEEKAHKVPKKSCVQIAEEVLL